MKTKLYSVLKHSHALKSLLLGALMVCGTMVSAQTFSMFNNVDPFLPADARANNFDPLGTTGLVVSVKFRVVQAGTISAFRFFKGNANTGLHRGTLWVRNADSSTNTILAQETFVGETAEGWQEQILAAPVPVVPGELYTLTIYHDIGVYAAANEQDDPGLSWDGDENTIIGPFIVLMGDNDDPGVPFFNDDPDPNSTLGNGTYLYTDDPDDYPGGTNTGTNGDLPGSYRSSNYFIDVVYTSTFLLPVSLSEFKAVDKNYDVNLSWVTSLEQNNLGFEVQRSIDGTNFEVLGFVDGAGESNSKKSYAYTDRNLEPGMYFYRLNQVDRDGRTKLSPVVTANVKRGNQAILYQGFPNPVKGQATIQYVLPRSMQVTLSLYDLNGRLVQVLDNGTKQTGSHTVQFDASLMQKGVYICKLEADGELAGTSKLIVQ